MKTKPAIVVVLFLGLAHAGAVLAGEDSSSVTFTKDVLPILQRECQGCHRPGQIAPMSFMSYQETRPWAESIKEAVVRRDMPPWNADPAYGAFANERRLDEEEIATIAAWVDGGARRGNPADAPPPLDFPDAWTIGTPDAIYSMQETYEVAASGTDEYIYFRVPLDFDEERFVRAIEVMPGNRAVLHHAIVYVRPKDAEDLSRPGVLSKYNEIAGTELFYGDGETIRVRDEAPVHDNGCAVPNGGSALSGDVTGGRRAILTGFVPGARGDVWPEGTARRIPPSSELLIQMHYNKTGKVELDRSSVGIIFSDTPPEKIVRARWVQNYYFEIPPGADNHEVTGCYTFDRDVHLLSYFPHMHVRGKSMEMTAIYPNGEAETLLSVPEYDFNWQHVYTLAEPFAIPKGTRILVRAKFDNSKRNAWNPDPTKAVRWGDPTYDEMMIGGMDYVVDGETSTSRGPSTEEEEP